MCVTSAASKWLAKVDGRPFPCLDVLLILNAIFLAMAIIFTDLHARL
jgi:hypothetical protein